MATSQDRRVGSRRISNPASPDFGKTVGGITVTQWFRRKWYSVVSRVILFGIWFVTLPSLDKSTIHKANGASGRIIVHPSRGTPGSAFQTQDGQWYVRTRRGIRKVSPKVGSMLKKRQRVIRSAGIAARATVAAGILGVIAGIAALTKSLS